MQGAAQQSEMTSRVLILERDPERAADLEARIAYLECEPVVAAGRDSDPADLIRDDWTAVIVGQIAASQPLQSLFQRLSGAERQLPVLYLRDCDAEAQLVNDCQPGHAWPLDMPMKRRQLSAYLARARRYRRIEKDRRSRITGVSNPINEVRAAIERVAEHDTTVLINGESGTGKELVARTIHDLSERSAQPFVPVNCGAIQPELLESELFGHDKGAFTGAVADRKGRFELASGGTLFLDEIGDMSLAMQVKLLRVLQEQEFRTVGGGRKVRCDCRIVAATHRDLRKAIDAGEFREDLFYRLNVFPITMPPLRKRVSDLPLLLEELMLSQCEHGETRLRLTSRALAALAAYAWPGNIRELGNLVERLAILNPTGTVDLEDLPAKYQVSVPTTGPGDSHAARPAYSEFAVPAPKLGDGVDLKDVLVGVEVRLIRQALQQAGGVVAEAARLLQLRRTTLVEKIRKYRLESDA